MTEDVEVAVNMVTQQLTAILDVMAPVKVVQTRAHYATWLSESSKEKIKDRNEAQKKAAQTKLKRDWDEYKCKDI